MRMRSAAVLPAYAGMILVIFAGIDREAGAPRIRGDDPWYDIAYWYPQTCSPHTRG